MTSELRELMPVPKVSAASRIITSRPATTSSRAMANPTTPGAHDHTLDPIGHGPHLLPTPLTFSGNGVRSGHGPRMSQRIGPSCGDDGPIRCCVMVTVLSAGGRERTTGNALR